MSVSKDYPLIRALVVRTLRSRREWMTATRAEGRYNCYSAQEVAWNTSGLRLTEHTEQLVERLLKELAQDGVAKSYKWKSWDARRYCLTDAFASLSERDYELLRKYFSRQWRQILKRGDEQPDYLRAQVERARAEETRYSGEWSGLGGIVTRYLDSRTEIFRR